MQIFIRDGTNGKTTTINNVDGSDKIISIKEKFSEATRGEDGKYRYTPAQQSLTFGGQIIPKDDITVDEANIEKDSTLHLTYKRVLFEERKAPEHFFGKNNQFIIDTSYKSIDNSDNIFDIKKNIKKNIIVVIPGSKIGSERNMEEYYVEKDTRYSKYHDVFRQQLPLPILINAYQNGKDVHIYLYDPAFELIDSRKEDILDKKEDGPLVGDIREVLDRGISERIKRDVIWIYIANITEIFKEIELTEIDYEPNDLLLNLYILPYSYNSKELNNLKDLLDSEYFIYLKNPHESLREDSFITNSPIKKKLMDWHAGKSYVGGRLPKHYTARLSKKDKQRQIKNIHKSSKAYKKGNYIRRPKLNSYQNKKSSWVTKFEKKYGKNIKTYKEIGKATGIPIKALQEVVKKGKGAYYSSGSRPNQTPESWGKARMYSYIMGGPTRKVDQHITDKYNISFK
tara:strand:- start:21842 stop:23206 length:1365 start_codon:yes stop_codon:yes gene_type:complete